MGLQVKAAYGALESDGVTPIQHPVELDRNVLEALCGPVGGATKVGAFALTPTGTNQQLAIAQGTAFLIGRENAQQGGYIAWSDVAENKNFGAPSGSPRIDTLLLRVYDPQYGTLPSGTYRAQWDVVAGTPAATPTARPDSDFQSGGSQYVPGAWVKWAEVRINPGDTVIPSGQIYQPGTVVSGVGTTWVAPYANIAGAARPTIYPSGLFPPGAAAGDQIYNINDGYRYFWTGSAFKDPYARGLIGGRQFTNNAWNQVTSSEAVITSAGGSFVTQAITLKANRRYRVRAKLASFLATSGNPQLLARIRETNVSGSIIAENSLTLNAVVGQSLLLENEFDNGGSDVSKTYCLSANSSGVNITVGGNASTNPNWIVVEDIGPASMITTVAWP